MCKGFPIADEHISPALQKSLVAPGISDGLAHHSQPQAMSIILELLNAPKHREIYPQMIHFT